MRQLQMCKKIKQSQSIIFTLVALHPIMHSLFWYFSSFIYLFIYLFSVLAGSWENRSCRCSMDCSSGGSFTREPGKGMQPHLLHIVKVYYYINLCCLLIILTLLLVFQGQAENGRAPWEGVSNFYDINWTKIHQYPSYRRWSMKNMTRITCFAQVRERCRKEWGLFQTRLAEAEKAYYISKGITPPNSTLV